MDDRWISPQAIFNDGRLSRNKSIHIQNGLVSEVCDKDNAPGSAQPYAGVLAPGFLDLQVNGGGGVLFNQEPTAKGISAIAKAHYELGTLAIMPTVITDHSDVLDAGVEAVITSPPNNHILGLHIEGPHISTLRRGTHNPEFIRPIDDKTFLHVEALRASGNDVMLTVAPEKVGGAAISQLAQLGAIVSLGHSDASAEIVNCAFDAGARAITHLFNGMSQMVNRAPGMVGAALNSNAYSGIIVDGIHVADEMIELALRAYKTPDRLFLVSDAMPTVGGPVSFELYGKQIRLKNGRLINEEGNLAGAHFTMADGVHRLINVLNAAPEQALRMAITVPAAVLKRPQLGQLLQRPQNQILCLDEHFKFQKWLDQM